MCNMKQILTGMHMGPTGLEDTWLWYDTEGRPDELVKTKSCDVAEVLWEGYKCWNGRVETSKVCDLFCEQKKTKIDFRLTCFFTIQKMG